MSANKIITDMLTPEALAARQEEDLIEQEKQNRPTRQFGWFLIATIFACILVLIGVLAIGAADGQTIRYYDKSGNTTSTLQHEGNRWVIRDKAGNPHGYWKQENEYWVHRDNAGNLLDRAKVMPQ